VNSGVSNSGRAESAEGMKRIRVFTEKA
jgi:hypothetical protein